MRASLPDILEADLDIVFVGINPGLASSKAGHYYAHKANRFWPMLHQSGLLPLPLGPEDDWKLLRFRIGMTDLVKRVTSGSADLSAVELKKGGTMLRNKIRYYQPRVVCFIGLVSYRSLFGPTCLPGPSETKIHTSRLFAIPSTSARNARYTNEKLLSWFIQLAHFRKEVSP